MNDHTNWTQLAKWERSHNHSSKCWDQWNCTFHSYHMYAREIRNNNVRVIYLSKNYTLDILSIAIQLTRFPGASVMWKHAWTVSLCVTAKQFCTEQYRTTTAASMAERRKTLTQSDQAAYVQPAAHLKIPKSGKSWINFYPGESCKLKLKVLEITQNYHWKSCIFLLVQMEN